MGARRDAAERFRIVEALGSGGNGTVVRAVDRALGTEVALKLLARREALEVFRFKREFRAFAGVTHPNLVRLYELFADDQQWFFSMELVRGVAFDRFVRPPDGTGLEGGGRASALDEERLREALYQTADAIAAIHRLGKVHRDVKPSNVMVEASGRVVVLDFGLVTETGARAAIEPTHRGVIVGSPAYMSPEQARDAEVGPESDWYSLGVMLYEALAGVRPFEGSLLEVLHRRIDEDPLPPSAHAPGIDGELEALCLALLRRRPRERAGATEILAALGRSASAATMAIGRGDALEELIGRERELARLGAALARARGGESELVLVTGASGLGKTALIEHFLDELDGRAAMALRGRCHEREALPYQALDSLVDAATSALLREPAERHEALLPPEIASLARTFPGLARVPAIAEAPALLPREGEELRRRALRALSELIWRLARGRTAVLFIDDLQWSDGDSTAALAEMLRPLAAIGVLVIATAREAAESTLPAALAKQAASAGAAAFASAELALAPLDDEAARQLARRAGVSDEAREAALLREGGGVPGLLVELARAAGSGAEGATLAALLERRLGAITEGARGLLEVCAVAGRPLALELAAQVAGCSDAAAALSELRAARLVRVTPHGAELRIEPEHARLRAAVEARLPTGRARALHAGLARALEQQRDATAAQRVEHWLAAGERARARALAKRAASEAAAAFAFHRAAELYGLALEAAELSTEERAKLGHQRAAALASGGQLGAAIAAAGEAAALATGAARRRLQQIEIECRLRHGDFAGGLEEVRATLAEVGLAIPKGRAAVLAALAMQAVRRRLRGERPRRERETREASEAHEVHEAHEAHEVRETREAQAAHEAREAHERIELLAAVTSSLVYVDPLVSALLQAHHLRAALDEGDALQVTRARCLELPRRAFRSGHDDAALAALTARLRGEVAARGSAELTATFEMCLCYAAHLRGRWRESVTHAERTEAQVREHGGPRWVLAAAQIHRLAASWYLGEATTIVQQMPRYLAEAEALGDAHALELLRVTRGNVYWLVLDRPDEAQAAASLAIPDGDDDRHFQLRHYLRLQAHVQIELYRGDGAAACARIERVWPAFRRSLVPRMRQLRIEALGLRGRSAVAAAAVEAPGARARYVALARRCAALLAKEDLPWAHALAAAIGAGAARVAGEHARVAGLLDDAAARATACELHLLAHAARVRRSQWRDAARASGRADEAAGEGAGEPAGEPIGEPIDEPAGEPIDAALGRLRACGIVNPAAVVDLLLPG